MKNNTYNGWTNYATWRINLEIFDGFNPLDYYSKLDLLDDYKLGESLKDYAEQVIFECGECNENSLAGSYALAFLSDVNWTEIASGLIDAYKEENAEEMEADND